MTELPELHYDRQLARERENSIIYGVLICVFSMFIGFATGYTLDKGVEHRTQSNSAVPVSQIDPCTVD